MSDILSFLEETLEQLPERPELQPDDEPRSDVHDELMALVQRELATDLRAAYEKALARLRFLARAEVLEAQS